MKLFALLFFLLTANAGWALTPTIEDTGLVLTGEIQRGDYERLLALYKANPQKFVSNQTVKLNSSGGNVREAIMIAKFLRNTSRVTMVDGNAHCVSACFFLLVAGGARITSDGRVGIHRPFYNPDDFKNLTPTQAREAYDRLDAEVREFLYEVRVPEDVVREMFATPSNTVKTFTVAEFDRRVGFRQPWFEELARSGCVTRSLEAELRCMGLRSAVDRVDMLATYLGQKAEEENRAWGSSYKKWANAELLHKRADAAAPPPPSLRAGTDRVDAAHPGWRATVKDAEFDRWVRTQSPDVQRLENSSVQEDAIHLLDLYKARESRLTQAAMLYLACDLRWTSGNPVSTHLDFVVDLSNRRVGKYEAYIDAENISFSAPINDQKATTRISRRSGAVSLYFEGLGTMEGYCQPSERRKF